jgi:hypothetical protein
MDVHSVEEFPAFDLHKCRTFNFLFEISLSLTNTYFYSFAGEITISRSVVSNGLLIIEHLVPLCSKDLSYQSLADRILAADKYLMIYPNWDKAVLQPFRSPKPSPRLGYVVESDLRLEPANNQYFDHMSVGTPGANVSFTSSPDVLPDLSNDSSFTDGLPGFEDFYEG